jgi:hypothetical protein
VYNFGDLFEIRPRLRLYIGSLSKAADSGAFVVRESAGVTDELCGLLIAGSGKKAALCCYIDNVINSLNGVAGSTFKLH